MQKVKVSKRIRGRLGLAEGHDLWRAVSLDTEMKVADDGASFHGRLSTDTPDGDKEVLLPGGADLGIFLKNPIMLYGHRWGVPPIGKWVGTEALAHAIEADGVFAARPPDRPKEQPWPADDIRPLVQQDILRGISVGFQRDRKAEKEPTDEELEANPHWAGLVENVLHKWTLLEASIVPLPCNEDALVIAVAKGMVLSGDLKKDLGLEATELSVDHWQEALAVLKGEEEPDEANRPVRLAIAILRSAGLTEEMFEESKSKPIPKPTEGESQSDFISRCMSNPTMQREYPDTDQRLAVCHTSWSGTRGASSPVQKAQEFARRCAEEVLMVQGAIDKASNQVDEIIARATGRVVF